jgi:hypothetical protein
MASWGYLTGMVDVTRLVDSVQGTTIINGELIRRLPIQK